MGQVALGFKNLLIKIVIFVIMAALLAWALGGTLLPRDKKASFETQGVEFAGDKWHWEVSIESSEQGPFLSWVLMRGNEPWMNPRFSDDPFWNDHTDFVLAHDSLYFAAFQADVDGQPWWFLFRVQSDGESWPMLLHDRLAVEQQLERLRNGMRLQSQHAIIGQRDVVLDPASVQRRRDEEARESDDAEN